MRKSQVAKSIGSRSVYEEPKVTILTISYADIITASNPRDPNQGEWDIQEYGNENSSL